LGYRATPSTFHDNAVWINGKKLLEDYTLGKTERVENSDIKMPYQVPDNCYSRWVTTARIPTIRVSGLRAAQRYYWHAGAHLYVAESAVKGLGAGSIRERFLAYLNGIFHPAPCGGAGCSTIF